MLLPPGGAVIEIRKEKNRGGTFLASSDNIPPAILGPDEHGEHFFLSGNEKLGAGESPDRHTKSGER
jgi:hypothetical protein